jgi:hypothetical protein
LFARIAANAARMLSRRRFAGTPVGRDREPPARNLLEFDVSCA